MRFSAAKIAPRPPYTPLGTIEVREGVSPLGLSRFFRQTELVKKDFDKLQDVDKINRLPTAEKPCKTRKHGLQMRAHT